VAAAVDTTDGLMDTEEMDALAAAAAMDTTVDTTAYR
jgi:hypothetical protein